MTLIKIQKVKNHTDIKEKLLSLISNTPKKRWSNDNSKTDLGFDVSYTDWQVEGEFEYRKFYLENVNKYFGNYDFINSSKSLIHNIWFHQYHKNDYHNWHIHAGCQFASIYYLELPNKKYSTEFYDYKYKEIKKYDVEEGDLIIFPSFIPHSAIKILEENRKTIISANYSFELLDKNFYENLI